MISFKGAHYPKDVISTFTQTSLCCRAMEWMRLILRSKASGTIRWLAVECVAINEKLYRAVDKHGKTLDFMLSATRDEVAAKQFFRKAIDNNGLPERVVIDKSGANFAGLSKLNAKFKFSKTEKMIDVLQVKYLNRSTARQTCLPESEYSGTGSPFHKKNCQAYDGV